MSNIVFITSAIHTNYGIYDKTERAKQTYETVLSAKKYIPDAVTILIDNSKPEVQQDDSVEFNQLIDEVDYYIDNSDDPDMQHFHNNITNYDIGKNAMEVIGILKALQFIQSDKELTKLIGDADRIFKLSGRYQITDKFNYDDFNNNKTKGKYVFKQRQKAWIGGLDFLLQTRLYSFSPEQFDGTVDLFQQIFDNMIQTFNRKSYIDVEHSMALFLNHDEVVELETVGLQGNIAPNGMIVID